MKSLLITALLALSLAGAAHAQAAPPPLAWNEAQLTWEAPTTTTAGNEITRTLSYRIETKSPGGEWRALTTTPNISYRHTGLIAGVHQWRVYAVMAGNDSVASNVASKTIVEPPQVPNPPANLQAR